MVAYLGRLDELGKEGSIDSLVEGLSRYARRAHLVFKRLWGELGLEVRGTGSMWWPPSSPWC